MLKEKEINKNELKDAAQSAQHPLSSQAMAQTSPPMFFSKSVKPWIVS